MIDFDQVVDALRAAGEPTRLRLLMLLGHAELTVSELVYIVKQSQPRISRHLKLLADAGLIERNREGAWVFYRAQESGPIAQLKDTVTSMALARTPARSTTAAITSSSVSSLGTPYTAASTTSGCEASASPTVGP